MEANRTWSGRYAESNRHAYELNSNSGRAERTARIAAIAWCAAYPNDRGEDLHRNIAANRPPRFTESAVPQISSQVSVRA
jgi:hypothetical protein